jgi:hypothetical protein
MNFICLTLRYPKNTSENLVYVCPDSILSFGVNMTDRGIMGSVVYTANPVALHVAEDVQTVYNLINRGG